MKNIILLYIFCLSLCSCSKEASNQDAVAAPIVLTAQEQVILDQTQGFAFDLFKTVSQSTHENLFISVYSLTQALGMLYNGAASETKLKIAQVLQAESTNAADLNNYFQSLNASLLSIDSGTKMVIANSIWAGIPLKKDFIDLNQKFFGAEVTTVDFSKSSTLDAINSWCSRKTEGKIPKFLDDLSPATQAILLNAVYFKAQWQHPFEKAQTRARAFYNADGSQPQIPMMNLRKDLMYARAADFSILSLPYGNQAFSMVLLLPNQGKDLDAVLENMNTSLWQSTIEQSYSTSVTLSLPRFRLSNELILNDALSSMGLSCIFGPSADFFAMSNIALVLTKVLQKSYIDVNEEGTEAAAVTGIAMETSDHGSDVSMIFDHPFVFVIREQSTDAILFMGKISKF